VTGIFLPRPHTFHLIYSLSLLENLTLEGGYAFGSSPPPAINPPTLTGTLNLDLLEGIKSFACGLLDLPNGLRFRKLILACHHYEDFRWAQKLLAVCSGTIEEFDVAHRFPGTIFFFGHTLKL